MLLSYLLDSPAIEWLSKGISLLSSLSKFFLFCFVFRDTVSLCNCPGACFIDQAGLEICLPLPPEW